MAGTSTGTVTESVINAAGSPAWTTLAAKFKQQIVDAAGTTWVPVLSHGYVPGTDVLSYDRLTNVFLTTTLRNQRRRQVGKGI
jgi:hypothetical protein